MVGTNIVTTKKKLVFSCMLFESGDKCNLSLPQKPNPRGYIVRNICCQSLVSGNMAILRRGLNRS